MSKLRNSHAVYFTLLCGTSLLDTRIQLKTWDIKREGYSVTFNRYDSDDNEDHVKKLLTNAGLIIIGKNNRHPTSTVFLLEWDINKLTAFFRESV